MNDKIGWTLSPCGRWLEYVHSDAIYFVSVSDSAKWSEEEQTTPTQEQCNVAEREATALLKRLMNRE